MYALYQECAKFAFEHVFEEKLKPIGGYTKLQQSADGYTVRQAIGAARPTPTGLPTTYHPS